MESNQIKSATKQGNQTLVTSPVVALERGINLKGLDIRMKTVRDNSRAPCCYWVKSHKRKICMSTAQDGRKMTWCFWSLVTSKPGDLTVSRKGQIMLRWTPEPVDRPAKGRCLTPCKWDSVSRMAFPTFIYPEPRQSKSTVKVETPPLYSLEDDIPNYSHIFSEQWCLYSQFTYIFLLPGW